MTRNINRFLLLNLILCSFLIYSCKSRKTAVQLHKNKPMNILFIAVDDLNTALGAYGNKEVISPNIDRLAAEGLKFERAYCNIAVCAPSRASLMSGLRPDATKTYDLRTPLRSVMPNIPMLPQYLRQYGYYTVGIGKLYHNNVRDSLSWNVEIPEMRVDSGLGYVLPKNIAYKGPGKPEPTEVADVPDSLYRDGAMANEAVRTLSRLAKQNQPFFLGLGFIRPHMPFTAPKKYWDLYNRENLSLAAFSQNPAGASVHGLNRWKEYRNYKGVPRDENISIDSARKYIHAYYACVSYVDAQIGKVMNELNRLGLAENTVIVLWSDHGFKLGDIGMWGKNTNYEADTHIPLLFKVPGTPEMGKSSNALVELVDVYPSLVEAVGLPFPAHLQGKSFYPLTKDAGRDWKKAVFSQYPSSQNKMYSEVRPTIFPFNEVMGYAIRTKDFRYVQWVKGTRDKHEGIVGEELYDYRKNKFETQNMVNDPAYASILHEMRAIYQSGWEKFNK